MIYILSRWSVDSRWMFESRRHIHLRWSCFGGDRSVTWWSIEWVLCCQNICVALELDGHICPSFLKAQGWGYTPKSIIFLKLSIPPWSTYLGVKRIPCHVKVAEPLGWIHPAYMQRVSFSCVNVNVVSLTVSAPYKSTLSSHFYNWIVVPLASFLLCSVRKSQRWNPQVVLFCLR